MDDERQRGARKRAVAAFAVAGLLLVGNIVAIAAVRHDDARDRGRGMEHRRDLPIDQQRDDGRHMPSDRHRD